MLCCCKVHLRLVFSGNIYYFTNFPLKIALVLTQLLANFSIFKHNMIALVYKTISPPCYVYDMLVASAGKRRDPPG